MSVALRVKGLHHAHKLVLLVISDCAHPDGTGAYPSVGTIAERADCSERSVQYATAALEKAGYITETSPAQVDRPRTWKVNIDAMRRGARVAPPATVAPGAKNDKGGVQGLHPKRQKRNVNKNSGAKPKKASKKKSGFLIPTLPEVTTYFIEKGSTEIEAQKFFNHFESNGWRVGGRSPMKDWKAAARNWILNIPQFSGNGTNGTTHDQKVVIGGNSDPDFSEWVKNQTRLNV